MGKLKLGDKLEAAIETVVPKKIITMVQEKDGGCGCRKRKQRLNELI